MKKVLVFAAIFAAAATWAPAQSVTDILGPWEGTINAAGQEIKAQLVLSNPNDVLTLMITTPQGEQPAENVKLEGNVLSFSLKFGPAALDIAVTVTGDTFAGQAESPFGPIDIKGKKVSEEELAKQREALMPFVGDWETYSEFQGKRIEGEWRVELVDGRLMGADATGEQGIRAEGGVPIRVQGDRLSWRVPMPYVTEDGAFVSVTVNRDTMTFEGKVRSSLGEIALTGKYVDTTKLVQAAYDDPASMIGDWDLEASIGGEVTPATMTIVDVEGRLKATISSDAGRWESSSIEFEKVGDAMAMLRVHTSIPELSADELVFEFIVDGDTFEGEEIYSNGNIVVTGKKAPGGTAPAAASAPAGGGITPKMVMGMLDTDKDGKITEAEAPEQLKQFFGLVDATADGGIDEAEAQTIADFMNSQGGGGAAPAAEPQASAPAGGVDAKTVMAMGDTNGDGKITIEETPEDLKGMFQFVDRNKDGGIDATEADIVARALNAQMAAGGGDEGITPELLMTVLDINEDGKIVIDESPEELKQFFTMVDTNQDGGIDLTETQMIADFVNAQAGSATQQP
jgi:Ca2+-binding EF-hand superfamily protein